MKPLLFFISLTIAAQAGAQQKPAAPAADTAAPAKSTLTYPYQLKGPTDDIEAVAFSPDGKIVASGGWDNHIYLFDALSGSLLKDIPAHRSAVTCLQFSRDSKQLISGSKDNTAAIWDVATGNMVKRIDAHQNIIRSVGFDKTGKTCYTASADTTMKIWYSNNTKRFIKAGKPITSAVLSHDGTSVWISNESSAITQYNLTGKALKTLSGHKDIVNAIALSPNNKYLLSGSNDKSAMIWDIRTGKPLFTLTGHAWKVNTVAFSADSKYLITGSNDGTVKLWETETGKLVSSFEGIGNNIKSLAFSPDNQVILSASAVPGGVPGAFMIASGVKREVPAPATRPGTPAPGSKPVKGATPVKRGAPAAKPGPGVAAPSGAAKPAKPSSSAPAKPAAH